MVRWVVLALALLFSMAGRADAAVSWQLFKSEAISLPLGDSRSPSYQYTPALNNTWVKIEYTGSSCQASAYKLEVRTAPNSPVVTVTPDEGIFKTPGPTLFEYTIFARQTKLSSMLCTANVWLAKAPVVQTGGFEFVGTVQFTGGSFAVALPVATQERVSHVWVEKPQFCQDVDVRGVDFITNGVPYPAKVADKLQNIYEIDGGAGERITHVQVLLAGPFTTQCQLGIYIKVKKDD